MTGDNRNDSTSDDSRLLEALRVLLESRPAGSSEYVKVVFVLTEVDPSIDPSGQAVKNVAEEVNSAAFAAAQTTLDPDKQYRADDVVRPTSIDPEAVLTEEDLLCDHLRENIGAELDRQNEAAQKIRAARDSVHSAGRHIVDAADSVLVAGILTIEAAQLKMNSAIMKYHDCFGMVMFGASGMALGSREFVQSICASASLYYLTRLAKKLK